jgi:endonuclease/exonuclease/phosphatase family metal-dependent hydrolase
MSIFRPKTVVRALVGLLSLGVMLTPAVVAGSAHGGTQDPKMRKVTPPNVFYPVTGNKSVKDQRTYSKHHQATDIKARCGATVFASHPGSASVQVKSGRYFVRVISGRDGLVSTYGYMSRALVTEGQLIQSGQPIGSVGTNTKKACNLYFSVAGRGKAVNPTMWLRAFVGKTPPVSGMFNMRPITVASFNLLGASHTASGGRYATYPSRLLRTASLFGSRGLDVIGTQEFQEVQYDYFVNKGYDKVYGAYYWDPEGKRRDTENAILWRKSTMEFVSGSTFDIPYFKGNIRHVPVVLLREKSSGRTAYFMNVHNPANTQGNAANWRKQAIEIERQKIIELRATGRPVIFTGDFNDRQLAFCPLTANKLSISPNSVPSTTCAYPKQSSIDWIFAAGQTRFSYFVRDTSTQSAKISDHPIVIARAHLQN